MGHVDELLSSELYLRTGGNVMQRDGLVLMSLLVVGIVGVLLGLRAWYYRYANEELIIDGRDPPPRRSFPGRGLARWLWGLTGLSKVAHPDDLRPMPSAEELKQAAERMRTGERAGASTESAASSPVAEDDQRPEDAGRGR